MGAFREVFVPDIGEFKDVDVVEVLVHPGDEVKAEQPLITVESDKATTEIPSPAAGAVKELKVDVGDKVSEGSLILLLENARDTGAEAAAPVAANAPAAAEVASSAPRATPVAEQSSRVQSPQPAPTDPPPVVSLEPVGESATFKPQTSPSVRKLARELGVDLAGVRGSGPRGRITREDMQTFVKSVMRGAPAVAPRAAGLGLDLPEWPKVDFAKFGPIERMPLSRIRKISGANLHRNWVSIPHVTQFAEADITELEAFRKASAAESEKQGFKLTILAFLIKACVTALRQHPRFNASIDPGGQDLVIKNYFHIGVAVDTPEGLVVPVIRDAERKGVFALARELWEISNLARERKLQPGDMQGGTFSISSLGGIGGTAFTPIINAPEVAILGVSRSVTRPVFNNDVRLVPRLILPFGLSYDHRVIDGADGARFTSYLASVLSDIRRSLL